MVKTKTKEKIQKIIQKTTIRDGITYGFVMNNHTINSTD